MSAPRIGVLALQGDFARHAASLEALGAAVERVALPEQLRGLDALVLPGGESTTMIRLIDSGGLRGPLESFVASRPVLATSAGVILLGRGAERLPGPTFGVLDVEVERNAYGRQIDSFSETLEAPALGGPFPGVFIRAPRIRAVGPEVGVIARRPATGSDPGEVVGVREGSRVGLCFHPELTSDLRFHRWFMEEVAELAVPSAASAGPRAGR